MDWNERPPGAEELRLAAEVYARHKGMLLKTAAEYLRDDSLAEDAVQDAVLRLARRAGRLRDMNEAELARYAKLTVRSAAVDLERRLHRDRLDPLEETPEALLRSPTTPEEDYIERDALQRALDLLPLVLDRLAPADRELLVGKYLLGRSDEALAAELGVQPRSLQMRLTRTRRKARRLMERMETANANDGSEL